jgi:alpha-tubulin suppressor-like RCC1 family protein
MNLAAVRAAASHPRAVTMIASRMIAAPAIGWRTRIRRSLVALTALAALAGAPASASAGTAAVSWGQNYPNGQLGVGYLNPFEVSPVGIPGLTNITAVAAAERNSYALLGDGTLRSWGGNAKGQLGDGGRTNDGSPTPVLVIEKRGNGEFRELTGMTAVSAGAGSGGDHAMALSSDGHVVTWGSAEFGQRGNGEFGYESAPTAREPRSVAVVVPGLEHAVAIASGGDSNFALLANGTVMAWGSNQEGALGLGSFGPESCTGEGGTFNCSTVPRQVALQLPPGVTVTAISAGQKAAYAALSNGTVMAWGSNGHGQLGTGNTNNSWSPVPVCATGTVGPCPNGPLLEGVAGDARAVSGGNYFALARLGNGEVVGWGANGDGNLGGHSSEECSPKQKSCSMTPKRVEGLANVTAVSAGRMFSLALSAGKIYAFGNNEHGALGDGLETGPETCLGEPCGRTPTAIQGLSPVEGMAASDGVQQGESHSTAYLESGSGPPPPVGVSSPAPGELNVVWTVNAPEYRLRWRVEGTTAWSKDRRFHEACSPSAPCSSLITGLEMRPYEIEFTTANAAGEIEQQRKLTATPVPGAAPQITGMSPNLGSQAGGTTVTIEGANFAAGASVSFGSAAATGVHVNSERSITAVSPEGPAGTIDVTVTTGSGTSRISLADQFRYVPAPTVTGVSPKTGPHAGGSSVTIAGTSFVGAVSVKFGSVEAGKVQVNSEGSITAEAPDGAGTVDVTVTALGGTSSTSSADQFTYGPSVSSVTPASGLPTGGTVVTITGTTFTGATAVKFGSSSATTFKVESATSIVAVSPIGTGTVDVTVTTPAGTSPTTPADQFSYTLP